MYQPTGHSGVSSGSQTFTVAATDGAGNADASPATFTWTVQSGTPDPGCVSAKQTAWVAPQQQTAANQYLYTPKADSSICVTPSAEQTSRGNGVANADVPTDAHRGVDPADQAAQRVPDEDQLQREHPAQEMYYPGFVTGRRNASVTSTDDLIEFYAKKWGVPEDNLRAQYTRSRPDEPLQRQPCTSLDSSHP